MNTRRRFLKGALGGVAGAVLLRADWPDRPVHIIVPFPPGGGADLNSRLLASPLQGLLGEPFVIENRSGAAGRIGTAYVAKADPDGETLLVTTESSIVIAPHSGVSMNYDPLKDLVPVSLLTRNTVLLVVHPSVKANTLQEFMALARAKLTVTTSTARLTDLEVLWRQMPKGKGGRLKFNLNQTHRVHIRIPQPDRLREHRIAVEQFLLPGNR